VDIFEENELVDIDVVQQNIAHIETELVEMQVKMAEHLRELGL
jgi:type I restriction enzyme M protein